MRPFLKCLIPTLLLAAASAAHAADIEDRFEDRDILLTVPERLPPEGQRAVIFALHGGGGNATHLRKRITLDEVAEKHGFIVAYLNGTDAGDVLPGMMHAWNTGGSCCGLPVRDKVDDIGYITRAVGYITKKYGVASGKVFATGHSNGSIMTQVMMCKVGLFDAAVTLSGPLNPELERCPAAKGRRILAIHGELDENVPVIGGRGTKGPTKVQQDVIFGAEAHAKEVFEKYGASYTIEIVPGTDHALTHLNDAITEKQGMSVGEKEARFFGLIDAR